MLKVNVIGLGYIGLPTALILAAHGVDVTGTDHNAGVIENLKSDRISFEEDGLPDIFTRAKECGIRFATGVVEADVYIIAVPTPYDKISKKIDPSLVAAAVDNVLDACSEGAVIVIESTVSPGTIDKFIRPAIKKKGFAIGRDIELVHAPERIIPGNMLHELVHNPRVIGADNIEAGLRIKDLYSIFCEGEIVITSIRTAEMVKVVENTYRDINIAFANELAIVCRSDNMNVYDIIKIANMHPRVNILQPGPGVGGHCIAVDPWFLVGDYPGLANIILAARRINDSMPEFVLKRVCEIMKEKSMKDLTRIGLYGLTYKENIDDVRESPTLQLLDKMEKHLAPVLKTYDPYVRADIVENQYHDLDAFLDAIDLIVIMVAHDEIRDNIDKLEGKTILDTKNIFNKKGVYKL